MPIRRRAWLSREGWYYSAVLAFILAGAVLKSVNLLVILAGMMIAPLIINWRLVMASLAGLTVRRKLPEHICAGESLTVEVSLQNSRRFMSSWMLIVDDWFEKVDRRGAKQSENAIGAEGRQHRVKARLTSSLPRKLGSWLGNMLSSQRLLRWNVTRGRAVFAHVPANGQDVGTYRVTLHRRGRYRFGPLRVSTRFPLGLVWAQFTLPADAELTVAPRIGRLSPEWASLIEAELVGDHRRHPQRGNAEGDYYGLRAWQSGDSMRWVHWRTTAKMGRPMVRQFERHRNREVALVLDPWLPKNAEESEEGLLEMAVSLAATAVADLTSRGHSRLTFSVACARPTCWTGPASSLFCRELLTELAGVEPVQGCYIAQTLERVAEVAPQGARLVIISPRAADSVSAQDNPIDLPCDPDNLCWIDVSSPELPTIFSLR